MKNVFGILCLIVLYSPLRAQVGSGEEDALTWNLLPEF
jgi:hypothetical protein